MSSERLDASRWAIDARGLGKRYALAESPAARLKQLLLRREPERVHWALQGLDVQVARGEVLGVVGRNGAGKSTLLQLLCGTLSPSTGTLAVNGRIAALLELGAGFNPEFTGRENVFLNAAILGLSRAEVQARLADILAFADIGDFIDQPVKTYSSGMFVRLAFSVATSVQPDILIIDEALSVGDGAFARKSFERIMALRDGGATVLFCSHSMYQVEALCTRALWLEAGRVRALGPAGEVCAAYQAHLNGVDLAPARTRRTADAVAAPQGAGRITGLGLSKGAAPLALSGDAELTVVSEQDDVHIRIDFVIDPALPAPTLAVGVSDANGLTISSASSLHDGAMIHRGRDGHGSGTLTLPRLPLLKGRYSLTPFLLCERALHVYDQVLQAGTLHVQQTGPEQGYVSLPRRWASAPHEPA